MTTASSALQAHEATVLVAGAGPAGLACAAELAHHGVDCLVVEPREVVSNLRPRAKTTSVRTMEHFRRWGIADTLRQAAPIPLSWSDQVLFCTSLSGREITSFPGAFNLTTTRDDRFAESSQAIPQPVVEAVLREHLGRCPGVTLELGSEVVGLDEREDRVVVTVQTRQGTTRRISVRYVVGCDGLNSAVRREIGASLVGRSDPRPNFNVVFNAPQLRTHLPPAVQYWVVGAATPGLIGRLDLDGTWWAIFPGVEASYGENNVGGLIANLVGRPVDHEVAAVDPWTARMLIADRFQTGRVFLVGEAAHLNPPWGGHGYNTSVGDAVNVGWKIAAVVQGWGGQDLLASYEPERRPVVARTVALAEANMGALVGDLDLDAETIQRAKRTEFYSLGAVLGYSYGGSPVVQGGVSTDDRSDVSEYVARASPGARLPHRWLADGRSLYDILGRGLTLVGSLASHDADVRRLVARVQEIGIPLSLLDVPDGHPWGDDLLLVRPDQHIAWVGRRLADLDFDLVLGCRPRGRGRRPGDKHPEQSVSPHRATNSRSGPTEESFSIGGDTGG